MRKITTATVLLVVLLMGCSSGEPEAITVDIEATVEAGVALAMASQTVATPIVEAVVTATRIPATATPRATPTARVTPTARATPTPTYLLEVLDIRCPFKYGYAHIEGIVKNVSNKNLENVTAVASWYTSGGTFITSDTALIEYNPILPGQTSPFKTYSTHNPAMKRCKLEFKFLLGGTISTLEKVSTPTPTATPTPTPGPRLILPLSVGESWHFNGNGDGKAKYPVSVIGDWNLEWEISNKDIVDAQIPFNLQLTTSSGDVLEISVSTSAGEHALNFEDYDSVTLSVEADYSTLWTIRLNPK